MRKRVQRAKRFIIELKIAPKRKVQSAQRGEASQKIDFRGEKQYRHKIMKIRCISSIETRAGADAAWPARRLFDASFFCSW